MKEILTYTGQLVLTFQTAMLTIDALAGDVTMPAINAAGFLFALACIAVGNLDRNSLAIPSIIGAICWAIILGAIR
jgi:hypothetical protein